MPLKTETTQPDARLDVSLNTADDCVGTYSIAMNGSRRLETQILWSPSEPDMQTEEVSFSLSGTLYVESTETIDGDTWRSLESFGLTEGLIDLLLKGEACEVAVAQMLGTISASA